MGGIAGSEDGCKDSGAEEADQEDDSASRKGLAAYRSEGRSEGHGGEATTLM
jgi:hypothetical protein